MGFMDFFKKEEGVIQNRVSEFKTAVIQSFSHLKNDLHIQRQWIDYLTNLHRTLEAAHENHKTLTEKDVKNIKNWISHLHENSKKHETALAELEKSVKETADVYNRYILEMYKKINEQQREDNELKAKIVEEVRRLIDEHKTETAGVIAEHKDETAANIKKNIEDATDAAKNKIEQFLTHNQQAVREVNEKHDQTHTQLKEHIQKTRQDINDMRTEHDRLLEAHKADLMKTLQQHEQKVVQRVQPAASTQPVSRPAQLSNPEQKLLNLLMAENDPVSYAHIAQKTGSSINTVRVIMNNLKKRGLVDEHTLPSGVKLFNASNKEKIKKMYNIEHL